MLVFKCSGVAMKDISYVLKDINENLIKEDGNGMLCVFTDLGKAEAFRNNLHPEDKAESVIVKAVCTIKACKEN